MPVKPAIDAETMYTTWVACNRNSANAARKLGMNANTLRYHVNDAKFNQRYELEFSGVAESSRRMLMIEVMNSMEEMVDILKDIARNGERDRDRIEAIRTMFGLLPPLSPRNDNDTMIEAAGTWITDPTPVDVETEIRNQLESNIIDANELRSSRR